MKKLLFYTSIAAMLITAGCQDYLDTENLYGKSLDSFYKTPTDIEEAMAGVYNAIYVGGVHSEEQIAANLLDDMMLGGGGPDDATAKYVDNFQDPLEDTYRDLWIQSYNGIARANAIIEKTPDAEEFQKYFNSLEEAQDFRDQAVGEAVFMRAFFYFRLAKFFGGVPLILAIDDPKDAARASITDTFAQIAADLKLAIETMPNTPFTAIPTSQYGHANKWVAQAYLGRVFLFYTGYMTNMEGQGTSELPVAGGSSLSKTDVAAYLQDCISNSGHHLASDFRNLWPYSYVNQSAGRIVLPWAADEGLSWVGQDGHSQRTEQVIMRPCLFKGFPLETGDGASNIITDCAYLEELEVMVACSLLEKDGAGLRLTHNYGKTGIIMTLERLVQYLNWEKQTKGLMVSN